jgi:cobalt-zinc-cadmium efflux system outer membrane protein
MRRATACAPPRPTTSRAVTNEPPTLRRAFHETLRLQEAQRAVAAWARRFAVIDSVVDKLAWAGEVSGYDRRRLAREQRSAEAKLAETRAELERGRARLAGLIGRDIRDDRRRAAVAGALPPPLPELQAQARRTPRVRRLAARAEAAQADNAAAQRNLPELTVGVGASASKMARCATMATP